MPNNVTTSVLFTDLVGSTELSARLTPGEAEQVRATHFGLLRDAVAATGGTEVKNLGDGLMVVYPSLGGALDGAVAMQQRIEQHNRKAAQPLGVRVGVSSGDATEDDGDYFGEPIVEASRLCAQAQGGQILTTDMVSRLARRSGHLFVPVGTLELKGMPEPVDTCEVLWEAAQVAAPVPLPARLAVKPATGVVGREFELDRLATAHKAAAMGDGHRVVFLAGEPGIGKTTLARHLAQRAHGEGATVLYGRCDEDIGVPYQPFVEALGGYISAAPEDALRNIDEQCLSELSRLLPQVISSVPSVAEPRATDADAERYLFFGAVTAMLSEMSAAASVVLVLDDLHWADKSTVLLLRHLVGTLGDAQVLIVATYRESDLTVAHPLSEGLSALRREASVDRVAVGGLDGNGVYALVEAMAGHELPGEAAELAHAVRRETGGNPFFTAEVLRHLAETGAVRQEAGRWVAGTELSTIGLPESVREVVGQRVRRLGDAVQQILTVASVIGRDFDLGLLARVAERSEEHVLAALELATASQIVSEAEDLSARYTFTHALFQRTLYDDLSASRRARLHRQIGELLEIDCGDDPGDRIVELAHHWIAATRPADARKAAAYARQAGERALDTLAPDEAVRWFRQAMELVDSVAPDDDPLPRLDILVGLGDALRQAGDPDYRETLLDAAATASELHETDRLVAAALANQRGMVSSVGAVDAERIAMLEAALGAIDQADSEQRARLLATLAAELPFSGNHLRVRELAANAEAVARRVGDDATLLAVLNLTALPLWVPDSFDRSVAASEEALTLADRLGDPVAAFWAAINRVYAMASDLDRDGIDAALDLAAGLADRIGQPYLIWQARYVRSLLLLLGGDADEAERVAGEALEIALGSGQPDAFVVFGANLAGIRLHQGRLEEFLPLVAEAAADNPGLPGFAAAHAMMLCECGRIEEAQALVEKADEADFHNAAYDYVWLTTTTLWADAVSSLGDVGAARRLYERLAPFESQGVLSGATFSGTVDMYLARLAGVLGRDAEALRLYEQADNQLTALRAPFWQARNRLEWAGLLARGNDIDRARAREMLLDVLSTAAANGCTGIESRARERIAALA